MVQCLTNWLVIGQHCTQNPINSHTRPGEFSIGALPLADVNSGTSIGPALPINYTSSFKRSCLNAELATYVVSGDI